MASRGASNPLAPFTKDFFVTAKGGDVLKRLSMVYGVLSKLEQADDGSHPAGIDSVSAGVSQSAEIRLSKDNEVRMMLCCVVVELFRLCAPHPPFENGVMLDMFKLIASQLPVLGNADAEASLRTQAQNVLKSLAEVQSPLVLVGMMSDTTLDASVCRRAEDTLSALLDALVGCVAVKQGKAIEDRVTTVLTCVITEFEHAQPPKFIDKLLGWLLGGGGSPNCSALAGEVLRANADKLEGHVAAYVVAVLQGKSPATEDDMEEEEGGGEEGGGGKDAVGARVCDRVHAMRATLLLPPYLPSALDPIVAALADDLEKGDHTVRYGATETLGRLFAAAPVVLPGKAVLGAKGVPLGLLHSVSFGKWLGRFTDMDAEVRKLMCTLGAAIMTEHERLADVVCDKLVARMGDGQDDAVRHAAVHAANDVLVWSVKGAPAKLVAAVAHACRDRSFAVRKEAATGLAQAYGTHMPALWRKQDEWAAANPVVLDAAAPIGAGRAGRGGKAEGSAALHALTAPTPDSLRAYTLTPADQDTWDKLSSLPTAVLSMYRQGEPALKQLVVQLLDTIMLPEKTAPSGGDGGGEEVSEALRARGLAGLYASLDASARRVFQDVQKDRRAVQTAVHTMLSQRAELLRLRPGGVGAKPAEAKAQTKEVEDKLERTYSTILDHAARVAPERELSALRKLVNGVPDAAIFRILGQLMDPALPLRKAQLAKADLTQRLGQAAAAVAAPSAATKKSKPSESGMDPAAESKALKDVVRCIVKKGSLGTCSPGMVPCLLSISQEAVGRGQLDTAAAVLQLLADLAGCFPTLFAASGAKPPAATPAAAPARSAGGKGKAAAPDAMAVEGEEGSVGSGAPASAHDRDLAAALTKAFSLAACASPGATPVVVAALDLLARLGTGAAAGCAAPPFLLLPTPVQQEVRTLLQRLALHASPRLAKRAVFAATALLPCGDRTYRFGARVGEEPDVYLPHLCGTAVDAGTLTGDVDPFFTSMGAELTSAKVLTPANAHLPSVLYAVGALALHAPAVLASIDAGSASVGSARSSASGSSSVGSKSGGVLSSWLAAHVQSDPEDDPLPAGGEGPALQHAAHAAGHVGGSAVPPAAPEDGEAGEGEDDHGGEDVEDDGFVRRKKGGKGGGVKRKLPPPMGGPAKKGVAAGLTTSPATFKGMTPSFPALTRSLSLRALGCIARGFGLKAVHLTELARAVGPHIAGALKDTSTATTDRAKSAVGALTSLAGKVLESGGDLVVPRGRQVLQPSSAASSASMPSGGASSAVSSASGARGVASASSSTPGRGSVAGGSTGLPSPGKAAGGGRKPGSAVSQGDVDAGVLRAAAASVLVRMSADMPLLDRYITPPLWTDVAFSVLDPLPGPRRAVVLTLAKAVSRVPALPVRYLPILTLTACLPEGEKELRTLAREAMLKGAVAGLRTADAQLKAAAGDEEKVRGAYTHRPEACVPFALFLLAHDTGRAPSPAQAAEFSRVLKASSSTDPVGHARKTGQVKEHTAALAMLVDVLLDAARKATASSGSSEASAAVPGALSLLNSFFNKLGSVEDGTGPSGSSAGLSFDALRTLFFYTIKSHMTTSRAFDKHPAEALLPLPAQLFRAKE